MKETIKWTLIIVAFLAGIFVLGAIGLGFKALFMPASKAIDRQVFEETKSYVHGKIQDLAKYYEEYKKAKDATEKEAVVEIIKLNLYDIDASKIKNTNLRNFLKETRGY